LAYFLGFDRDELLVFGGRFLFGGWHLRQVFESFWLQKTKLDKLKRFVARWKQEIGSYLATAKRRFSSMSENLWEFLKNYAKNEDSVSIQIILVPTRK
jgi:hypothetical protein